MKNFIFLFLFFVLKTSFVSCQKTLLINQYLDFYKPYTHTVQQNFQDEKIRSSTSTFQLLFPILKRSKYEIQTGLTYKYINQKHIDYAKQYATKEIIGTGGLSTYFYSKVSRIDLINQSHSFGIPISFFREILVKNQHSINLGSQLDFYFIEYYYSKYKRKVYDMEYKPQNSTQFYLFSPVASQLSIFSTYKYAYNDRSSIGIRLQAGTNLYSNWDQFKRYAWLGVGLEWEIGRRM
jgi:hypothetical protein